MNWWPENSNFVAANPRRDNVPYAVATREVRRVDMHRMNPMMKRDALAFAKNLSLRGGGPFSRRHSMEERLQKYVNKKSRCGKYIEVLEEEVPELTNTSNLLLSDRLLPVELGFNRRGQVCKVAYTVPLKPNRVAFLCIGVADGGLKTFYVNPTFKWRAKYQCTDERMNKSERINKRMKKKKGVKVIV